MLYLSIRLWRITFWGSVKILWSNSWIVQNFENLNSMSCNVPISLHTITRIWRFSVSWCKEKRVERSLVMYPRKWNSDTTFPISEWLRNYISIPSLQRQYDLLRGVLGEYNCVTFRLLMVGLLSISELIGILFLSIFVDNNVHWWKSIHICFSKIYCNNSKVALKSKSDVISLKRIVHVHSRGIQITMSPSLL